MAVAGSFILSSLLSQMKAVMELDKMYILFFSSQIAIKNTLQNNNIYYVLGQE